MADFDLHMLLNEIGSMMKGEGGEKKTWLSMWRRPRDLPIYINADQGKLRQILINLISNAVKYTKQGVVILRAVPAKRDVAGGSLLRFEVEDTGPGIKPEDRERIFAPFLQLGGRPLAEAGTGLGLAICKQYVGLIGRADWRQERAWQGFCVLFRDPGGHPGCRGKKSPDCNTAASSPLQRGSLAIVFLSAEDQPENLLLLRKLLEPLDFDLCEAANGREAVAHFEMWRPHLIWMDIRMPLDGRHGGDPAHQVHRGWIPNQDHRPHRPCHGGGA